MGRGVFGHRVEDLRGHGLRSSAHRDGYLRQCARVHAIAYPEVKAVQPLEALGSGVGQQRCRAAQHAIKVARRQGAKSLELRAVMALIRLLQEQGKRETAQLMLAQVYGWFAEGFNTLDLIEARTLLDELSGDRPEGGTTTAIDTPPRRGLKIRPHLD